MTSEETKKGLMILSVAGLTNAPDLSNKETASYLIKIWHTNLIEYSFKQFEIAIMLYIRSNRYFPTISDILKEIPIPDKYLSPGVAFTAYMNEKLDRDNVSHNLIIKAVKESGYAKHYINQIDPQTKERYIRPKIEKKYRELVELEEKREGYKLITKNNLLIGE